MAVLQEYALTSVPAAAGPSDPLPVGHLTNKTIFISGGVFSTDVEISHDGTLWQDAPSGTALAVTAAGIFLDIAPTAKFIRLNLTAFTSGTPTAKLLAHSSVDMN